MYGFGGVVKLILSRCCLGDNVQGDEEVVKVTQLVEVAANSEKPSN